MPAENIPLSLKLKSDYKDFHICNKNKKIEYKMETL